MKDATGSDRPGTGAIEPGETRKAATSRRNRTIVRLLMVPTSVPVSPRSNSTRFRNLPWRLVNEFEAAAILGMSVKFLRHQRQLNLPPRYRKLNGHSVRYELRDLEDYVARQPGGGGVDRGTPCWIENRGRARSAAVTLRANTNNNGTARRKKH